MELTLAIRIFEVLLGLSLVIQTLEYLRLPVLDRVTLWSMLSQEIPTQPMWLKSSVSRLLEPGPYRAMLGLRLVLAIALMLGLVGLTGAAVLFLMALLLLLRWRGAFNGGSDFMTLVCLSGLLLAHLVGAFAGESLGWQAGFWYVSLHTISSYFVSSRFFWTQACTAHCRRAAFSGTPKSPGFALGPSPCGKAAFRWPCSTSGWHWFCALWPPFSISWCSGFLA